MWCTKFTHSIGTLNNTMSLNFKTFLINRNIANRHCQIFIIKVVVNTFSCPSSIWITTPRTLCSIIILFKFIFLWFLSIFLAAPKNHQEHNSDNKQQQNVHILFRLFWPIHIRWKTPKFKKTEKYVVFVYIIPFIYSSIYIFFHTHL